MKTFVIGSMKDLAPEEQDAFSQAAQALGEELATRGHSIILCSADQSTVDPHVLAGFSRTKPTPKTFVYRPDHQTMQSDPDLDPSIYESSFPDLDITWKDFNGGWRVVHLGAMNDADVVLALGGSPRGTGTVIYSAEVVGKPVALLPTFKGVAEFAWRDLSRYYVDDVREKLIRPWAPDSRWAQGVVAALEGLKKNNPFKRVDNLRVSLKLLAGIGFLVAWLVPLISPDLVPLPGWATVFLAIAFASMAGSLARNTLRSLQFIKTEWQISSVIVEVLLGLFLAILIVALTELAGFLVSGQAATFPTAEDVQRAGWVLSISAFASSLLIERAWRRVVEIGEETVPN